MARKDGRSPDEMRRVRMTRHFQKYPAGSVLIEVGDTKVSCAASVEDRVPFFCKGTGEGWVTAEYSLLPGSTLTRSQRDSSRGRVNGRSCEIQRLIGRALRSVVDRKALGERTITIDCDVIQADGGTRTAAITGAFVALVEACDSFYEKGNVFPVKDFIAAVSMGISKAGEPILDLCYEEDSAAIVDMNVVMTDKGEFIELQGTGENNTFDMDALNKLIALAKAGNEELNKIQRQVLGV